MQDEWLDRLLAGETEDEVYYGVSCSEQAGERVAFREGESDAIVDSGRSGARRGFRSGTGRADCPQAQHRGSASPHVADLLAGRGAEALRRSANSSRSPEIAGRHPEATASVENTVLASAGRLPREDAVEPANRRQGTAGRLPH